VKDEEGISIKKEKRTIVIS